MMLRLLSSAGAHRAASTTECRRCAMTSSQRVSKLAAVVIATLMASAAIAEDMTLPGPSGDCLSKALAQLSLDTAACAGRYPAHTELYGQCITGAHSAY